MLPSLIVRKIPAKILFTISHLITSLALAGFAGFALLYIKYPEMVDLNIWGWIPLVMLIVTVIMRTGGILPVTGTISKVCILFLMKFFKIFHIVGFTYKGLRFTYILFLCRNVGL